MTILAAPALAACGEAPTESDRSAPPIAVLISDPIALMDAVAAPAGAASALVTSLSRMGGTVYVSVAPGTAPTAASAAIVNLRTAESVQVAMMQGGFDPVGITAEAGDELEVTIALPNGELVHVRSTVPARRRPRVVRTSPNAGRTDVALNSIVGVIFSEPIDPASLDISTVRLLDGETGVAGMVRPMSGSSVGVEFVPGAPLAPGTTYQLVLADRIMDLAGDPLEVPAPAAFTTMAADPVRPTPAAPGSHLAFTAQPANRTAWLRFDAPAVVVTARTPLGVTDASFNGQVTLTLRDPSGEAALLDPVTGFALIERRIVLAISGVATFEFVGIAGGGGTDYTLVASATGFESATSAPFDVTPNPACFGCWDYTVAPIGTGAPWAPLP